MPTAEKCWDASKTREGSNIHIKWPLSSDRNSQVNPGGPLVRESLICPWEVMFGSNGGGNGGGGVLGGMAWHSMAWHGMAWRHRACRLLLLEWFEFSALVLGERECGRFPQFSV